MDTRLSLSPPTESLGTRLSQAWATVESVFSPGTAASVMARPITLCVATLTVLVILAAAVQPGAVAYLEEVPWDAWNPLFWRAAFENTLCANVRSHTGTLLYKFYFGAKDGDKLHISMRVLISPRLTRITNCFAGSICGPKRSQAFCGLM